MNWMGGARRRSSGSAQLQLRAGFERLRLRTAAEAESWQPQSRAALGLVSAGVSEWRRRRSQPQTQSQTQPQTQSLTQSQLQQQTRMQTPMQMQMDAEVRRGKSQKETSRSAASAKGWTRDRQDSRPERERGGPGEEKANGRSIARGVQAEWAQLAPLAAASRRPRQSHRQSERTVQRELITPSPVRTGRLNLAGGSSCKASFIRRSRTPTRTQR